MTAAEVLVFVSIAKTSFEFWKYIEKEIKERKLKKDEDVSKHITVGSSDTNISSEPRRLE